MSFKLLSVSTQQPRQSPIIVMVDYVLIDLAVFYVLTLFSSNVVLSVSLGKKAMKMQQW